MPLFNEVEEAPIDGNQYARKDASWEIVVGGGGGVQPGDDVTWTGAHVFQGSIETATDIPITLQGSTLLKSRNLGGQLDVKTQDDVNFGSINAFATHQNQISVYEFTSFLGTPATLTSSGSGILDIRGGNHLAPVAFQTSPTLNTSTHPFAIGAYTLPNTDGAADQVLVTDGAGGVTWQNQSGGGGVQPGDNVDWTGTHDFSGGTLNTDRIDFPDQGGGAASITHDVNGYTVVDSPRFYFEPNSTYHAASTRPAPWGGSAGFGFLTSHGSTPLNFRDSIYINPSDNNKLYLSNAANEVDIVNGVNPQSLNVYNTFSDASNYERGGIWWDTDVMKVGTASAGTGTARAMDLENVGRLTFSTTGQNYIEDDGDGIQCGTRKEMGFFLREDSIQPSIYSFSTVGSAELTSTANHQAFMLLQPEMSQSATGSYSVLSLNALETAIGSGQNYLIDGQVDSVQKFAVESDGTLVLPNIATADPGANRVWSNGGVLTLGAAAAQASFQSDELDQMDDCETITVGQLKSILRLLKYVSENI